jgi:transaldolase
MTLFLDSANVDDARQAAGLGFVVGITTNPTIVARLLGSGSRTLQATADLIAALCDVFPGVVMHQLIGETLEEREAEARRFLRLRRGQVGLKIPCTPENFGLAHRLACEGHRVAMTAIFSPAQVCLACEAGAAYIFPYVNRSTRLLGDGVGLVRQMRAMVNALGSPLQILAASVKSPQEAVDTLLAGAHGLTIPLELIRDLGQHPLSERTIEEFGKA